MNEVIMEIYRFKLKHGCNINSILSIMSGKTLTYLIGRNIANDFVEFLDKYTVEGN